MIDRKDTDRSSRATDGRYLTQDPEWAGSWSSFGAHQRAVLLAYDLGTARNITVRSFIAMQAAGLRRLGRKS